MPLLLPAGILCTKHGVKSSYYKDITQGNNAPKYLEKNAKIEFIFHNKQ